MIYQITQQHEKPVKQRQKYTVLRRETCQPFSETSDNQSFLCERLFDSHFAFVGSFSMYYASPVCMNLHPFVQIIDMKGSYN